MNTRFLPKSYGNTLDFIVTGVSHELQNNDWETHIETTVIPKTTPSQTANVTYQAITETLEKVGTPAGFNTVQKGVEIAKKLMKDLNLKDFQASAIVGNLIAESGLYPDRIQGAGVKTGKLKINGVTGYGYAQWTSKDRQQNLADTAKTYGVNYQTQNLTDDINYAFLLKELQKSSATKSLRNSSNLRQATDIVLKKYEKPYDQGEGALNKRAGYAQQILTKLKA
jgi:hypothetical protein